VEFFFGGTWSADGEVMVFASGGGLWQVSALGGEPSPISLPEEVSEIVHWPHFLPVEAGPRVLAFAHGGSNGTLHVYDVETGRFENLGPGDRVFYSPSGHLVYQPSYSTHDLWALPFSLDTLSAAGEAFPIAENARIPSVARDGTLVYLDGAPEGAPQLVWLDRRGNKTGEIGQPQQSLGFPALSPDGRLVAVEAEGDVWVYDIERGVRTRLSTGPEHDRRPVWSPAGDEVAFTSLRAGNDDIFLRQADGSGEEMLLATTPRHERVSDWSLDGNYLLYHLRSSGDEGDLWYLMRSEDGSGWDPHSFLQTSFGEVTPRLSPDGRYVAYLSNESGQYEVYVRPFPDGGRKVTVSSNGGTKVRWSRDGNELFYVEGQTLVAVSVVSGSSLSVDSVTRLFEHPSLSRGGFFAPYDVSADGQRFILPEAVRASADASEPSIHVVQNWYEEFRDREQD
jgi:Tol biopolymer transport system component